MPGKPLNTNSKRVLCVCRGGNSRSVGLAYILKYCWGHDALACGVEGNDPNTIRMLCEWADHIICMRPEFKEKIPLKYHGKIEVLDVGSDRYFQPHPDLLDQAMKFVQAHPVLRHIKKNIDNARKRQKG